MKVLAEERTIYLVGLIIALFTILFFLQLPSVGGALVLGLILVLAWRVGVLLDRIPFNYSYVYPFDKDPEDV